MPLLKSAQSLLLHAIEVMHASKIQALLQYLSGAALLISNGTNLVYVRCS